MNNAPLMDVMYELEDFPPGTIVLTPSGRRAVVLKHLAGSSKRDAFSRLICRYEGGKRTDLVTLQPHFLRLAEPAPATQIVEMSGDCYSMPENYSHRFTELNAA